MASTFKDQIASDLAVFMNPDEFAETHEVDGQQINCVYVNDVYQQKGQKVQDGVYENVAVLYVKVSELQDRPVPEQHMRIDGDLHLVLKCGENMGILEITLEANET
ncbi:MAG: hypothetical protein APF81_08510 [Desulfosporosinus sp. BRH_c37]|nr:MAG: hypothetical protein APF81_08510 [Desulfosporosinus sp. BRH_c37]